MKKLIFTTLVLILLFNPAQAEARVSASSAALATEIEAKKIDNRTQILKDYLESYNSPLAPYASVFVKEADKNNLDWKLVASIAGNESYFGQMIPYNSYNAWGYGVYGNNVRRFSSWEDGIGVVSRALRTEYMDKWSATNIKEIGLIYAADPRWASKVTHFYEQIESFEKKVSIEALSISI